MDTPSSELFKESIRKETLSQESWLYRHGRKYGVSAIRVPQQRSVQLEKKYLTSFGSLNLDDLLHAPDDFVQVMVPRELVVPESDRLQRLRQLRSRLVSILDAVDDEMSLEAKKPPSRTISTNTEDFATNAKLTKPTKATTVRFESR
mmetsp:Transcript_46185/g.75368  ORF Transcript_46185/g.75368 Transcript_46185/m.75368 type:complete len:147 (-) Transcript_46185:599-1039(-)|eukprot:CAMPEP_0184658566 /NCGR_PEP_ID=MMETSP0308-20130426/25976_1 /TAXON_ID=38269 /ORGANISM="Gloeochaete witrockiana, Strain SAG 46.84" /LENGTH=146 /DNA_ID=CAMNT_0027097663 /DNA_START=115 /DNA_END=555 /DNA_ORIENTATION=+